MVLVGLQGICCIISNLMGFQSLDPTSGKDGVWASLYFRVPQWVLAPESAKKRPAPPIVAIQWERGSRAPRARPSLGGSRCVHCIRRGRGPERSCHRAAALLE